MEDLVHGTTAQTSLRQCSFVSFASGAVMQAVMMATMCASFEYDDGSLGKTLVMGELVGAVVWGVAADVVGRKEVICLSCVVSAAACASMAFAASFATLKLSAFAAGLGSAGCVSGAVLLLVETASAKYRGRACLFGVGLSSTFGAASAATLSRVVADNLELRSSSAAFPAWRLACLLVAAAPFLAGISASAKLDESVRWLVAKGRYAAARAVVERTFGAASVGPPGLTLHEEESFEKNEESPFSSTKKNSSRRRRSSSSSARTTLAAFDRLVATLGPSPYPSSRSVTSNESEREEVKEEANLLVVQTTTTTTSFRRPSSSESSSSSFRGSFFFSDNNNNNNKGLSSFGGKPNCPSQQQQRTVPREGRFFFCSQLRAASICALGLCFLISFGLACVVALVRLEFDKSDAATFALHGSRRRRLGAAGGGLAEKGDAECPAIDASLVRSALVAEVVALVLAFHLADHLGRRPTLAAGCAAAAAGVIVVAAPSYFPERVTIDGARSVVAAVVASRGALRAASATATLLVAEMHATTQRATATALALVLAKAAALLAADWVVAPNPVATVALLLTLVDVSAAWAALALPLETNAEPVDTLKMPLLHRDDDRDDDDDDRARGGGQNRRDTYRRSHQGSPPGGGGASASASTSQTTAGIDAPALMRQKRRRDPPARLVGIVDLFETTTTTSHFQKTTTPNREATPSLGAPPSSSAPGPLFEAKGDDFDDPPSRLWSSSTSSCSSAKPHHDPERTPLLDRR